MDTGGQVGAGRKMTTVPRRGELALQGECGALEQINPFDLPRVKVKNWSVYEFHKVLERFLG